MLVLCDFDGTITVEDVTNLILDKFTGPGWRSTILPRYRDGQIGHLDIMQLSYADLATPEATLKEYYKDIPVRPGFPRLVEFCKVQDWPLVIVSGGLDFYIREFLPPDLPFHSYIGEYDPTHPRWEVRRPDWPRVAEGEDFKVRVFEELRDQNHQAGPSVFMGDGLNDFKVANRCDYVFAVRGSRLAQMCVEAGKPSIEFDDFGEVVAGLQVMTETKNG